MKHEFITGEFDVISRIRNELNKVLVILHIFFDGVPAYGIDPLCCRKSNGFVEGNPTFAWHVQNLKEKPTLVHLRNEDRQ